MCVNSSRYSSAVSTGQAHARRLSGGLRESAHCASFFYQLSIRKNANTQKPDPGPHSQLDPHVTYGVLEMGWALYRAECF